MSLIQYFKDTRGELRHVSWPTQKQTIIFTALVAGISILMAVYLGLFDYLFSEGLNRFLDVRAESVVAPEPFSIDAIDVNASGDVLIETVPTEGAPEAFMNEAPIQAQ